MAAFMRYYSRKNNTHLFIATGFASIVFVLTTSDDQKDTMEAYDQVIAGCIVKSEQSGDQFVKLVTLLENFVVTVKFPPKR